MPDLSQRAPNSSFSTISPNLQLAWDSTSLGALKTCPRYYQYNLIEGWRPRVESVHLTFGAAYHAALEAYDHARSRGQGHEAAQREAVRRALLDTWDQARSRPWSSDDPNKNRLTLVRSVVWYLEQFAEDPLTTVQLQNGKPAVELSFRFESGHSSQQGESFLLCGHLDRLVTTPSGETWVLDRKTTKSLIDERWFAGFSPDNQFTLYTLAADVVYFTNVRGVIVDGAQIAVTFSRFQRGIVTRHPSALGEWFAELPLWLGHAERYAAEGYWPMNDKACGNYGGCPYRPICSMPPSTRQQWLEAQYHRRVWDPLQTREV